MTTINSLPFEVLRAIHSHLPPKEKIPASQVCKLWLGSHVTNHLANIPDERTWNIYFSNIKSPVVWEAVDSYGGDVANKFCIRLNVDKEQLTAFKMFAEKKFPIDGPKEQAPNYKFHIKDLNITYAPSKAEIDALFSLIPRIETVYFTDCNKKYFSPSLFQYPPSLKKLFFRNVNFNSKSLTETFEKLAACEQLRKIFIQPCSTQQLPRKELSEIEKNQKREITILEPCPCDRGLYKANGTPWAGDGYWSGEDEKIREEKIVEKCSKFWKSSETICISPAEKFKRFLHIPNLFYNPLRQQMLPLLKKEVFQDLKKQIEENPNHALALNCLGALLFFLAPTGNLAEAEQHVKKALEIEPDNILSRTLLMCFSDQKCKTNTLPQEETRELITKTHCQLMDYTSKKVIWTWLKIGGKGSFLADTAEGKYWLTRQTDYHNVRLGRSLEINGIASMSDYITLNFEFLIDHAMDHRRGNLDAESYYNLTRTLCLNRYPSYVPFLNALSLEPSDNSEWEKAYSPEELEGLKILRDSYIIAYKSYGTERIA
jgi:hypothetical protein